jgi:cytoskeletal protein RodZ
MEPKKFNFRSPYYKSMSGKLRDVKERVEDEVESKDAGQLRRKKITFKKQSRKQMRTSHYRWAMLRTVIIGIILVYLLYRGIIWAETTDFSEILDTFKDA